MGKLEQKQSIIHWEPIYPEQSWWAWLGVQPCSKLVSPKPLTTRTGQTNEFSSKASVSIWVKAMQTGRNHQNCPSALGNWWLGTQKSHGFLPPDFGFFVLFPSYGCDHCSAEVLGFGTGTHCVADEIRPWPATASYTRRLDLFRGEFRYNYV